MDHPNEQFYLTHAYAAIDRAQRAGTDKSLLRWRCSPAQRYTVVELVQSCAQSIGLTLTDKLTEFRFLGVPLVVDYSLAPSELILERLTVADGEKMNFQVHHAYRT